MLVIGFVCGSSTGTGTSSTGTGTYCNPLTTPLGYQFLAKNEK